MTRDETKQSYGYKRLHAHLTEQDHHISRYMVRRVKKECGIACRRHKRFKVTTNSNHNKFSEGAFIGKHGSWNHSDSAGYDVVFVPFSNGKPAGDPVNFVTGFQGENGKTFGRPVGVTVDPREALIVTDDLSNTIWRVTLTR